MNGFHTITVRRTRSIEPDGRRWFGEVRQRQAFTLIELLVVISIIAVLASLIVGLAKYAGQSNKRSRVRAELNQVLTAIEAYKAHFGFYPPDNYSPTTKTVNPVTNPLFYELTGVILDENKGMFHARDRQQNISTNAVGNFFNRDGFVNAGTNPKELKAFISLKASQRRAITSLSPGPEIEVLAVSVDWPPNDPNFPPLFNSPDPQIRRVNPWRYVRTNPTNNPDGIDLWAEFVEGGKIKVICNWSKDVLDK